MQKIVNQQDIQTLLAKDEVLKAIYEQYGTPPNWQKPEGFVTVSKIILGQQISLAAADAHFEKLNNYIKNFTPENILKLTDDEMRSCYISRQKTRYLKDLAQHITEEKINFEKLSHLDESEIRATLCAVKGIGEWTADIYLMFSLQHKDIFPKGDIAVINTVRELYQVEEKEAVIKISTQWKPFRSLASYFLWHYYLKKRNRNALF